MGSIKNTYFTDVLTHCRKAIYIALFFSLFINILMLATAVYMLNVYDRVLASYSIETLVYLTIITLFLLFIMSILDIVRSRILLHTGVWFEKRLTPLGLEKAPDLILQGNEYCYQIVHDIAHLRQFLTGSPIVTLLDVPWVPIYLIFIYFLSPVLGHISLFGAAALILLGVINEQITHKPVVESSQKVIKSIQYVSASLRNAEVIQAMGIMPQIISHWVNESHAVIEAQAIATNRSNVLVSFSKLVRLSLQIFILGVGAYLVLHNKMTAGGMIAASILMGRALAPVEQAISLWKNMISAYQMYRRLDEHYVSELRQTISFKLPKPAGRLHVDNVWYRQSHTSNPILKEVSFMIEPGDILAVIGPTGSGKSTLARLILGVMKPSIGVVRLDGSDIYTWDRNDIGHHVGYLPQDIEVFPGTVKSNIARMQAAQDEKVLEAAKLAGIHEFILSLPQSYDTPIGPGGANLSGGQLQRIGLARAIYGQPSFIVLDEPNSNLDTEGELKLVECLKNVHEMGATQILITHKIPLIQHATKVLLLKDGKLTLFGPKDEVLKRMGM